MEIALHQSSSTKTWFVKVGGEELMDVIGQVSICFWPYSVFYNKSDENLIRNKKKNSLWYHVFSLICKRPVGLLVFKSS